MNFWFLCDRRFHILLFCYCRSCCCRCLIERRHQEILDLISLGNLFQCPNVVLFKRLNQKPSLRISPNPTKVPVSFAWMPEANENNSSWFLEFLLFLFLIHHYMKTNFIAVLYLGATFDFQVRLHCSFHIAAQFVSRFYHKFMILTTSLLTVILSELCLFSCSPTVNEFKRQLAAWTSLTLRFSYCVKSHYF